MFNFSNLYWLEESIEQGGLEVSTNEVEGSENNWAIFKKEIVPTKPVQIKTYKNGKKLDLHEFVETRLVSQKFIDILSQYNISGWSTYPVILVDKKNNPVDGYVGLAVTGKCGPQQREKRVKKQRLNIVGTDFIEVYIGYYFNPETWDGSDIFSPAGTAAIIVTEKVKKAFEESGITNVSFTPLTELESLQSM